jgi:hypothetical protein
MINAMSPELVAYLWAALAAPVVLLGVLILALVLRYRGRRIPALVKWIGAFLAGFCVSSAFILVTEPLWFIVLSLPVLWIAWLLARSGRFRLAGLMGLGLTLPGTLWLGRLVLTNWESVMAVYGIGLYLRFVLLLVGAVMATGLIVIGDHAPRVPAVLLKKPGTVRDPMALGNAMAASVALGPFPLPTVVAELAAFFATLAGVTVATNVGLPLPITVLGGALLFMVVSTELWYLAFPGSARGAWSGFAYVGHLEQERWRATTGTEPPNTAKKFHEWLRDNVERPETRWAHAELLAVVGRLDEARAMALRIEAETPAEAFDREAMLDYIEWIDGGEIDFEARLREADTIGMPESRERLFARGLATIALARDRAQAGGDWKTPLEKFADETGRSGWGSFRADTRRRRMMASLVLGLVVAAVFTLPSFLAGPQL